ncbi:Small nuclear ribonucleoprotein E [Beauveria bassiana]|uniref:Small nuclear ribonucleoprotein E n=1 Tax=Beauveria bassiana TaxID=176275 RepID=A0A2N6NRL8_BEABA|nr:Small nuclear ribonucleoprotein E [Beauveria bassiana]
MTGRGGGGGRRVLLPPMPYLVMHGTIIINGQVESSISLSGVDQAMEAHRGGPIRKSHVAGAERQKKRHLAGNATVSVWLYEQLGIRVEGKIRGFDEFMNLVLDDAVEVRQITKTNDKETRRPLGQILLKGDNVSLIQNLSE